MKRNAHNPVIEGAAGALEASFDGVGGPEDRGAVVGAPHPQMGGQMQNPVVDAIVAGLLARDVSAVRFNYRGVGASDGQISGERADAIEDYAAAVSWLLEQRAAPLVACGYSFGAIAAMAVACRDRRVERVVMVAPPLRWLTALPIEDFGGGAVLIAGDADQYSAIDAVREFAEQHERLQLHVLEGADHFFGSELDRVTERVAGAVG